MSDVKDINDHIVNEINTGDTKIVEYDKGFEPDGPPLLTLSVAVWPHPADEGAYLFGINHGTPPEKEGTASGINVSTALEATMSLYFATAEQLIAKFPPDVAQLYRETLVETFQDAHTQFIDAVNRYEGLPPELAKLLENLSQGDADALATILGSPDAEDPHQHTDEADVAPEAEKE